MPRSSVSSGRIWSPVTSEGTGSGRAECSRGFSRSGLGAVQKFMLSRKRGISCYFGFVLMAQTPWKQTGEVLSLLSRLLLRSFEQREERKDRAHSGWLRGVRWGTWSLWQALWYS